MTRGANASDPKAVELRTFHDAIPAFRGGTDTPRDYLERCRETIGEREPEVRAFVVTNIDGAREAADMPARMNGPV